MTDALPLYVTTDPEIPHTNITPLYVTTDPNASALNLAPVPVSVDPETSHRNTLPVLITTDPQASAGNTLPLLVSGLNPDPPALASFTVFCYSLSGQVQLQTCVLYTDLGGTVIAGGSCADNFAQFTDVPAGYWYCEAAASGFQLYGTQIEVAPDMQNPSFNDLLPS